MSLGSRSKDSDRRGNLQDRIKFDTEVAWKVLVHKSRMQVINQSETVLHAVADGVLVSLSESTITSCAVAVANVQSQINVQMGQSRKRRREVG